jgi:sodium-coupled neutral amino acid transporter 11
MYLIEFEPDSDTPDDDAVGMNMEYVIRQGDIHREQPMPLLVGLLDASAVRRSPDTPMGVDSPPEYSDVDPDELIAEQATGGGVLNSIVIMANSILGTGAYPLPLTMTDVCPSLYS